MAYCTKCGTQVAEGVKFCTSCGTPVGVAQQPQPQPQAAPQPPTSANILIQKKEQKSLLLESVIPAGFEPTTHSLEGCCSIQLSYGTILCRTQTPEIPHHPMAYHTLCRVLLRDKGCLCGAKVSKICRFAKF